jgi:hypothetical protein
MAFQYEALEEGSLGIRVLTLLPGAPKDPIRIRIHRVTLPEKAWEAPPYEALSYVWGEQKDASTASVTVEDEDGKDIGTITITENLNAALPYLRFRRQPRTL